MKYYYRIIDRYCGKMITDFETLKAAKNQVALYEARDQKEGIYEPDFYQIVKADEAGEVYYEQTF